MKCRYLLFLTALLFQAAPLWSSDDQQVRYRFELVGDIIRSSQGSSEARFRIISQNGAYTEETLSLQQIRLLGFEKHLPLNLVTLDPFHPLPQDLGSARKRIECTFTRPYNGQSTCEVVRPTEYPLIGEWQYQEDGDHRQTSATLLLKAPLGNNRWEIVYQQGPVAIPYIHVSTDPQIPGNYYYDGSAVFRHYIARQIWQNPRTQAQHVRTAVATNGEIDSHVGYSIVYVEPFEVGNDPLRTRGDYHGEYTFARDLITDNEKILGREEGQLLYSDGNHIYLPHVTQELWRRDDARVGFFITSYKQDRRLNFISQARLVDKTQFPEGLYQLYSIEDLQDKRIEKWKRLGEDVEEIEARVPRGISSIPGIGAPVSHKVPVNQAEKDVLELQQATKAIVEKTQRIAVHHNGIHEAVIVLGPTGSGKTTIIHGLAGAEFIAERGARGLYIRPLHLLPEFNIGHTGIVGTTLPTAWYDNERNVLFWDCPGFGDPRGSKEDIINAYSIDQLFKIPSVKVLMVAPESSLIGDRGMPFLNLLNELTHIFPNNKQLPQGLSLVITKQRDADLSLLLPEILQDQAVLTPQAKELLSFFIQNPTHIFTIPYPRNTGSYHFEREGVLRCLQASRYMDDPCFTITLKPEAQLLAGRFAQKLNEYIGNYLKTEGTRRMVNFCRNVIENHDGSVANLRTRFANLVGELRAIQLFPQGNHAEFANHLERIIDVTEIRNTINNITFLKKMQPSVNHNMAEWSQGLFGAIQKIEQLAIRPQPEYDIASESFSFKGILLGLSDINTAFYAEQRPIKRVNAYTTSTFFLDADITRPGLNLTLIAPQWAVIGTPVINLSGLNGSRGAGGAAGNVGQPGEHGCPGGHGGHGGNLFGKSFLFKALSHLTVSTNGGHGGHGGNGGEGGNGLDGVRGNLDARAISAHYRDWTTNVHQKPQEDPGLWNYFGPGIAQHEIHYKFTEVINTGRGTDGTLGGNGGQGGACGIGGYAGEVTIEGSTWIQPGQNRQRGTNGTNGLGGRKGIGGMHGQHCVGHRWTSVVVWDDPWKGKHALPPRGHHDRVFSELGYAGPRGKAGDGHLPIDLNTNGQGHLPAAIPIINTQNAVQTYKVYYDQQATNEITSSFVRAFPNL